MLIQNALAEQKGLDHLESFRLNLAWEMEWKPM